MLSICSISPSIVETSPKGFALSAFISRTPSSEGLDCCVDNEKGEPT